MFKSRFQHSILGLLVLVTLVAIVMASIMAYRQSYMARLRWIDEQSSEAEQLFPKPSVVQNSNGFYEFEYYAKNRGIQRLIAAIQKSSFRVSEEAITITAESKADADAQLAGLRASDILPPGNIVVRGRVLDARGRPVSGAIVDLMGSFFFVNCFQTRDDGTFTLALSDENPNVPANGRYHFRIRTFDEKHRWESLSFRLDSTAPVKVVEITVFE